jgi:hypothetical protein
MGKHYCIPNTAPNETKAAFGLISQLLALKSPLYELPYTPSVRIVQ